uniref:RNase H type-1 domain-containing protein n=1 Tax=Oryza rufipogon TaxID=4529 RepID=A0A0E0QWR0_ORYRU
MMETDCQVSLQLLQSKEKDRSDLAYVINAVKDLMGGDREILFSKVCRSQNRVSQCLANKARCESLSGLWPDNSSAAATTATNLTILPSPRVRKSKCEEAHVMPTTAKLHTPATTKHGLTDYVASCDNEAHIQDNKWPPS